MAKKAIGELSKTAQKSVGGAKIAQKKRPMVLKVWYELSPRGSWKKHQKFEDLV